MMEQDAKTKWCPFVRMALVQGMAGNRTANMTPDGEGYANIHAETRCIGSECMAWVRLPVPVAISDGDCGLKNRFAA